MDDQNMKREQSYSGVIQLQRVSNFKIDQARTLRKKMTPAERKLWMLLRGKQCGGLKFRRQQIINGFIADFFCAAKNIVVEVDGSIHDTESQKSKDEHRRKVFSSRGIREIRFRNEEILNNANEVQKRIVDACG